MRRRKMNQTGNNQNQPEPTVAGGEWQANSDQ
jgi:hypothetical protein